ncbi:MAG: hypothetical protein E7029_13045 [Planctomycetaceae bacterium]|nr:hypothetical protein [Planctomycetaceae bacterium]
MTGSQTALGECRRAWDLPCRSSRRGFCWTECRRAWDLQPKISTTENTEYQQDPPSKALDA